MKVIRRTYRHRVEEIRARDLVCTVRRPNGSSVEGSTFTAFDMWEVHECAVLTEIDDNHWSIYVTPDLTYDLEAIDA